MKSIMIGMLAETPIHPGAGRSSGFVDLPVARESITQYPVIVGSSLKGALKDKAREKWPDKVKKTDGKEDERKIHPKVAKLFGEQESAGDLVVSDAKLLLLPVRSLTGHYKWATCPYLIERLRRDVERTALKDMMDIRRLSAGPEKGTAWANDEGRLFLEEREFEVKSKVEDSIRIAIEALIYHKDTAGRLKKQLIILNDNDFQWFASYGLQVSARNVLKEETKKSENLWYEETLSADSLFYTILFERQAGALECAKEFLNEQPYLQAGGNETVGQGWFAMKYVGDWC